MAFLMTPEEAAEERYGVGIYFGQDIDGQVLSLSLLEPVAVNFAVPLMLSASWHSDSIAELGPKLSDPYACTSLPYQRPA